MTRMCSIPFFPPSLCPPSSLPSFPPFSFLPSHLPPCHPAVVLSDDRAVLLISRQQTFLCLSCSASTFLHCVRVFVQYKSLYNNLRSHSHPQSSHHFSWCLYALQQANYSHSKHIHSLFLLSWKLLNQLVIFTVSLFDLDEQIWISCQSSNFTCIVWFSVKSHGEHLLGKVGREIMLIL